MSELIKYLQKEVNLASYEFHPTNKKSWGEQIGILLSVDQVKEIINGLNELTMADMTHEYNQAEAERTWPQLKEQIEEPLKEEIERLKGLIKEGFILLQQQWKKSIGQIDIDWEKFKTENKI